MKFLMLLAFAAFTTANAWSSASSVCIPTVTTVPVPRSIEEAITQAESYAADILTIGSILSTAELSSPTLTYAESVLESYAHSYYSLITALETYYASPTVIAESSVEEYTRLTSAHSTLASAISAIVSFGETHPSFETAQNTLLSIEVTQSSILTELSVYTEVASPSVYSASEVVSEATLTSPSILATFISIYTADIAYPSVESALSSLSASVYTLPSTVVSEVLTFIESPSTVSRSVIESLESCYESVYSELTYLTSFTESHTSVVSALTDFLSAASSVSSLSTAMSTLISYQMPTLTYDVSVISHVTRTWPSFTTDIEILSGYTATSPALSFAIGTLESSFYNSPSIASSIYSALVSPSTVTCPTQLSEEELSHSSLVTAIDTILSWESDYSSSASTLTSIVSKLTSNFADYRTLLTAASYISTAASPSIASASYAISSLKTIVSDITSVLTAITYVTKAEPSLSCAESIIESYAEVSPTVALSIFSIIESPSIIRGHTTYYAELTASYESLASAIESIVSAESSYSELAYYEESFIYAASVDSSILSQYTDFSTLTASDYEAFETQTCSSSGSY
jgi:hypothetical protein